MLILYQSEYYITGMQAKYEEYFGENIIPFKKDGDTLSAIIDRANKRLPPFSSAKDASDKGFKDCLLWLSILDYFKNNGEDTIVFVTDDKTAFRNYKEELMDEFNKVTGKTIEIHPNSYYKELLIQLETPENKEKNKPVSKIEELPNLELLRREVEETVEALCGIECEDYFGEPQWNKTFTTSVLFDKDYAKDVFAGLHSDILSHIFESSVPASKILDLDGRIVDTDMEIPIKNLEKALSIYQHILNNYSQFNEQFFEAVAKILNRNYVEPSLLMDTNDVNLPF